MCVRCRRVLLLPVRQASKPSAGLFEQSCASCRTAKRLQTVRRALQTTDTTNWLYYPLTTLQCHAGLTPYGRGDTGSPDVDGHTGFVGSEPNTGRHVMSAGPRDPAAAADDDADVALNHVTFSATETGRCPLLHGAHARPVLLQSVICTARMYIALCIGILRTLHAAQLRIFVPCRLRGSDLCVGAKGTTRTAIERYQDAGRALESRHVSSVALARGQRSCSKLHLVGLNSIQSVPQIAQP